MKEKKTKRGFKIFGEFLDDHKAEVRVQQSSVADRHAVWVFVEGGATKEEGAIHLTAPMVRKLIKALEKSIE